jgi:hypothetical protein
MDTALSFLISAGIIAFGVGVVAGTIIAGWPWTSADVLKIAYDVRASNRPIKAEQSDHDAK